MKHPFPTINTERLGMYVANKSKGSLRLAAKESGVSAATLSRITHGKMVDAVTFVRVCHWLGIRMELFVTLP